VKPYVFKGENGNLYLVRCPKCRTENYSTMVASGQCYSCGYKATEEDLDEREQLERKEPR
jgi:ribosomal protein L37E